MNIGVITNNIPPIVGVDFFPLCISNKYIFNTCSFLLFFNIGINIKPNIYDNNILIIIIIIIVNNISPINIYSIKKGLY